MWGPSPPLPDPEASLDIQWGMAETLRHLLIQRAARLQGSPALVTEAWGTLSYLQYRNRVEGVALGLMAGNPAPGQGVHAATATPWDWVAEVATACCGLVWQGEGTPLPREVLGGAVFNDEAGRQAYHDREEEVSPDTPFLPGWTQGAWLGQLQRLNRTLGWDHRTVLVMPPEALATAEGRAAAWSALYAGACLRLERPVQRRGWFGRPLPAPPAWDPAPFAGLL